jgi:hypothetical protein
MLRRWDTLLGSSNRTGIRRGRAYLRFNNSHIAVKRCETFRAIRIFYYLPLSTSRTLPRSSKVCLMCGILTRNKPGSHGHRHYTVDVENMFSRQRQERPIDLALLSHTRTIHTKNHRPSSSVEGLVDEYDGVEWESKDDVILDEPSLMDLPAEIRGMIYDHLPKPSHGKYYRASNMK